MSSAALAFTDKIGPIKSAEAFRTISEAADELDVPQHVLRFWESRFTQIKPVKRAGGRRYYRPDDIDLLKGIRALLYSDGLTIKGVQKVLKERGHRHVAQIGRGDPAPAPAPLVIEKIVYVEKPAEAPRMAAPKKRPTHLRAVPSMSLPFFDMLQEPPVRDFPVLDAAPAAIAEVVVACETPATDMAPVLEVQDDSGMAVEDRTRLEELLDELAALKDRLLVARTLA